MSSLAKPCTKAVIGFGFYLLFSFDSAIAQYAFDRPMDNHDEDSVRYFGSAKDEKGLLLADVTFLLDSPRASFVFVTDEGGRFRGVLPKDIKVEDVTATCSKAGMEVIRTIKRRGPAMASRLSVQVDCSLRPILLK